MYCSHELQYMVADGLLLDTPDIVVCVVLFYRNLAAFIVHLSEENQRGVRGHLPYILALLQLHASDKLYCEALLNAVAYLMNVCWGVKQKQNTVAKYTVSALRLMDCLLICILILVHFASVCVLFLKRLSCTRSWI